MPKSAQFFREMETREVSISVIVEKMERAYGDDIKRGKQRKPEKAGKSRKT